MELLPAIDLKDGKVVRLTRGDYEQVRIYSEDPLAIAQQWVDQGANWLHLVDLDAALAGKLVNFPSIQKIGQWLSQHQKHFEVGGGVRDLSMLKAYIEDAQASRVILGTIAFQDPEFVRTACKTYPGKIAIGMDVKDGKIGTHGWTKLEELSPLEWGKRFEEMGASCIVYTDIQRDGMLSGLNFEGIQKFTNQVSLPVIVAGGLKDQNDIETILSMKSHKIQGAITGKAIYEGTLDLQEAFRKVRGASESSSSL